MLAKVSRALKKYVAPVSTRKVQEKDSKEDSASQGRQSDTPFERFKAPHLSLVPQAEDNVTAEAPPSPSVAPTNIHPDQSMSGAFVSLLKSVTARSAIGKEEGLQRYRTQSTSTSGLRKRLQKGAMFDDEAD